MSKVWINGSLQTHVTVNDRAFTYGDGLFETIRVRSSKPELLDAHLKRLEDGLVRLKYPRNVFTQLLSELEEIAFSGDQVLKLIVSRGEGLRGYSLPDKTNSTRVIQLSELSDYSCQSESGVAIRTCQYQMAINPVLAGIKHLNRLEQVMARSEWQDQTIADGVVTDLDGYVVECTMSNIFWSDHQTVYTPGLERCGVKGVMRDHVISKLAEQGIVVQEGNFTLADLKNADEIFITNSLIQVWPVIQYDDITFDIGPVTRNLQKLLLQEC